MQAQPQPDPDFEAPALAPELRRPLLEIARAALRAAASGQRYHPPRPPDPVLLEPRAAFVSLYLQGLLRGCIGSIAARRPLYEAVADAAHCAAREDPRFAPVTPEEEPQVKLEISVLSPLRRIQPGELVVGRHGLLVSHAGLRGLLLPQVAVKYGLNAEDFLAETCRKAGLDREAWKQGAVIEAFTAQVFGED
jgi:AmmeMemoRadiSam system protein A